MKSGWKPVSLEALIKQSSGLGHARPGKNVLAALAEVILPHPGTVASNSSRPAATWPDEKQRSGSLLLYLAHGRGTESSLKAGSHMVSSQDWKLWRKFFML